MKYTIKLSKADLETLLVNHFQSKGKHVSKINFNVSEKRDMRGESYGNNVDSIELECNDDSCDLLNVQ